MTQTALGYAAMYRSQPKTKRKLSENKDIGKENLTTKEVAKLTRATLRQLQWWDEQNLVVVRHSGHMRIYTPEDVRKVRTVVLMRSRGISLQRCRRLLRHDTLTVEAIKDALDILRRFKFSIS